MKAKMSLEFDPSENFHDYHIEIRPERDDAVDVSTLFVYQSDQFVKMIFLPFMTKERPVTFKISLIRYLIY